MITQEPASGAAPPAIPAGRQRDRPQRRSRWLAAFLGSGRRKQIRVAQWLVSALTYAGCGLVMAIGLAFDWVHGAHLAQWLVLAALSQALFYAVLRSGLSERFADPALTGPQIAVGLLFADWAYVIEGPGRAIALMPMLLVLVFGAFSLHWKKIAVLTLLALAGFAVSLVLLQWLRALQVVPSTEEDLAQDLVYFATLVIVLPAAAGLAAQLSRLRSTLRAERSALATALADVQRLAAFDELTGLANRRHARDFLAIEQARASRADAPFSVVLIDLDHFKHINDTLGHDAGDKVLCAFAEAARPLLRSCDLMARWGGEEFLIVMPDTDATAAHAAALRLLDRVRMLAPVTDRPMTFSAGVAQWRTGESFTATVTRADDGMYTAKRAGRDRVLVVA
ncbi:GGDEF domain-containing protein [Frateuria hangzhouensis]|uniref:GGDEF domain-containing protein n=1 Tax=Frateuria hangzhouensis TaxID=2995589 RepID=UPI00226099E6|nr:diguanylate cyclase [Frateuria sp. STR12]MCX7515137.1 diguanylate cyclase [Frateuria sp. STR12]